MTIAAGLTDEELARRSSGGDREAFSALYERHYRGVYDLVMRVLREQEAAADVVQNSFLNAWLSLQKRKITGNVRAWLYTIARNSAINEIRRGRRVVHLDDEMQEPKYTPVFARIDADRLSDPESIAQDSELAELVWTSAAALNPREYSLLDLHLRRGLSTDALSQTLGVSKGSLHTQLSRLRDSLEESVTVTILMRRGRRDCPGLNDLFAAAGAGLTLDLRQGVARHLRECSTCQESRKRFLAPAEIFAGLALIPAPVEASRPLWLGASAGVGVVGFVVSLLLTPVRWGWSLFESAGTPVKAAAGAAVAATVAVAVAVATLLTLGGDDAQPPLAAGVEPPRVVRPPAPLPPASSPRPTSAPSATPAPVVAGAVATPVPGSTPAPTPAPLLASTPALLVTPTSAPLITPAPAPTSAPALASTATPAPAPVAPVTVQVLVGHGKSPKQPDPPATVAVTIIGSDILPVEAINVATVLLQGVPAKNAKTKDVDGDGILDLRLHFKLSQGAVRPNEEICIAGETFSGVRFAGCGAVQPVPAKK